MNKQKRILIIEDESLLKKVFQKLLIKEGYKVNTSENGINGFRKAKKNYYDLIYTGIMMPKMDGIAFMENLKLEKVKYGKLVVFSSIDTKEMIDKSMELGASEYVVLSKITPIEGFQIMKKLLEDNK